MNSRQFSITLLWIAVILGLAACGQAATRLPTETLTPPTATTAPTQPPTLPPPTATLAPTIPPTPEPVTYPWWNERVFYEIFVRSFL